MEILLEQEFGISALQVEERMALPVETNPENLEKLSTEYSVGEYYKAVEDYGADFSSLTSKELEEKLSGYSDFSRQDKIEKLISLEVEGKVPKELKDRCFLEGDFYFCAVCETRARNFICRNPECLED